MSLSKLDVEFGYLTNTLFECADNFGKVIVCKYGSDPLKTYLPNSDIDITLIPMLQQTARSSDDESSQAALSSATTTTTLSSLNFYHELDR